MVMSKSRSSIHTGRARPKLTSRTLPVARDLRQRRSHDFQHRLINSARRGLRTMDNDPTYIGLAVFSMWKKAASDADNLVTIVVAPPPGPSARRSRPCTTDRQRQRQCTRGAYKVRWGPSAACDHQYACASPAASCPCRSAGIVLERLTGITIRRRTSPLVLARRHRLRAAAAGPSRLRTAWCCRDRTASAVGPPQQACRAGAGTSGSVRRRGAAPRARGDRPQAAGHTIVSCAPGLVDATVALADSPTRRGRSCCAGWLRRAAGCGANASTPPVFASCTAVRRCASSRPALNWCRALAGGGAQVG